MKGGGGGEGGDSAGSGGKEITALSFRLVM